MHQGVWRFARELVGWARDLVLPPPPSRSRAPQLRIVVSNPPVHVLHGDAAKTRLTTNPPAPAATPRPDVISLDERRRARRSRSALSRG